MLVMYTIKRCNKLVIHEACLLVIHRGFSVLYNQSFCLQRPLRHLNQELREQREGVMGSPHAPEPGPATGLSSLSAFSPGPGGPLGPPGVCSLCGLRLSRAPAGRGPCGLEEFS